MTTMQQQTQSDLAIQMLDGSRNFLSKLIETLDDSQLVSRSGGHGNHALWVMGHIAFSDDSFVSAFTGQPGCLPESYKDLFGQGASPSENAGDYPSRDELLGKLEEARARVRKWVATLEGDAALEESPEDLKGITPNAIHAAFTLANHEYMHAGQLASVRSSLGMGPVFG